MENVLAEIVDRTRLINYAESSLGDVEKLQQIRHFFSKNEPLQSMLEEELLSVLLVRPDNDAYIEWLCSTLEDLTPEKWIERKPQLMTAICNENFTAAPSLIGLALKSNVLCQEDVISRVNLLPSKVLLKTLHYAHDRQFVSEAASRLTDDSVLIVFLVNALHKDSAAVNDFLMQPGCLERVNEALFKHHDSHDQAFRKFSLALLRVLLETIGVSNGDLIIAMLTVAEEKQVHLVEPVLNLFVNAVRTSELTDVSWTLMVFRRLFNHQTTCIRLQSLQFFFSLTAFHDNVFRSCQQAFYCDTLLNSLDYVPLYLRGANTSIGSRAPFATSLHKWFQQLQDSIEQSAFERFVVHFIKAVCSRSKWNSVALLYVSEAIVSLRARPIVSEIELIANALNVWSFQETLLKKAVRRIWIEIACRFSPLDVRPKVVALLNCFVEDCDCVRQFVLQINSENVYASNPVALCSMLWSDPSAAEVTLKSVSNDAKLWPHLSRLKDIPSLSIVLRKILTSSEIQSNAIQLILTQSSDNELRKAVVDVMSLCGHLDRELLAETLSLELSSSDNWMAVFCIWAQQDHSDDTRRTAENYFERVATFLQSFLGRTMASDTLGPDVIDSIAMASERYPDIQSNLLSFVCTSLPVTPQRMTPSLLRLLLANIRYETSDATLFRTLRLAWQTCLECRRATTLFSSSVDVFVRILFDPFVVSVLDTERHQTLCDELDCFVNSMSWFGEMFYRELVRLLKRCPEFVSTFASKLAEAVCYGPTFRKDQRIVLDTEHYVLTSRKLDKLEQITECQSAVNVRANSISFARKLSCDQAKQVVDKIQSYDRAVSSTRKRYFNNSTIHRVKTRAWQAILVLLDSVTSTSNTDQLLEDILGQLMNDSHQLTVRILMEWCAVKILLTREISTRINIVVSAIEKASTERLGCICSYLSILMHLCCSTNDCRLISDCISLVLPWTMSQHFAVRVHSQFIFQRIFALCKCSPGCHSKFAPQHDALNKVVTYGIGAKNMNKFTSDFYMADCIVTECETYDLLFSKIPRAYGLTDVDCIPAELFDFDPKLSKDSGRKVETTLQLDVFDENAAHVNESAVVNESNFQRKLVPLSVLFDEDRHPNVDKDQLIVVASLIDRVPNLGGISRTCEIFGVSELVLPNVKLLEQNEFKTLSVSSHHWLPIRGVGPQALENYLEEKKSHGYTLIGVEQTAQSVSLEKFRFPKKSLLLLGNEKEGLPLNLIHLMDLCVEIPQQGVVRSLNVHVSAAILVWEYRKQNLVETPAAVG